LGREAAVAFHPSDGVVKLLAVAGFKGPIARHLNGIA
jgi:hypothetical protein